MKKISLAFVLFLSSLIIYAVPNLNDDEKLIIDNFSNFQEKFGFYDLTTINSAHIKGNDDARVVTVSIKGDNFKSYILLIDNSLKDNPKFTKSIVETNFARDKKPDEISSSKGFFKFISLEEDNSLLLAEIEDNKISFNSPIGNPEAMASPLVDCCIRTIRNMNLVELAFFIAGEPESVAGLILICAYQIIFNYQLKQEDIIYKNIILEN